MLLSHHVYIIIAYNVFFFNNSEKQSGLTSPLYYKRIFIF